MRCKQSQSWILLLATRSFKYLFLSATSCILTYVVSIALRLNYLADISTKILFHGLSRAGVVVLCLIVVAVITESLRQ